MKEIVLPFLLFFLAANVNAQWTQTNGPNGGRIVCIAASDSIIIAANSPSNNKGFVSTDYGYSWKTVTQNGFPANPGSLLISGSYFFAGSYVSSDLGITWTQASNGLPSNSIVSLLSHSSDVFAGLNGGGVYMTSNYGANWSSRNSGLLNLNVNSLAIYDSMMCAGTVSGIYFSPDYGASWNRISAGLPDSVFTAVGFMDSLIIALSDSGVLYTTTDFGTNWTLSFCPGMSFLVKGNSLFAYADYGVFKSVDTGNTWLTVNAGLFQYPNSSILSLAGSGSALYAGTNHGLYVSVNDGGNWNLTGCPGISVSTFAKIDSLLFSGVSLSTAPSGGGIFMSSDGGVNWNLRINGLTDFDIRDVATFGGRVFAASSGGGGIFMSPDTGTTWLAANSGIDSIRSMNSFAVIGGSIYASCAHNSLTSAAVYRSVDSGTTWQNLNYPDLGCQGLAVMGNNLFAAGSDMWMTSDSGATWVLKNNGLPTSGFNWIFSEGNKLFASPVAEGVYISSDTGNSWVQAQNGLPVYYSYVRCGGFDGTNYFLGVSQATGDSAGVYISTDNCFSWNRINEGLPDYVIHPQVWSLFVNGNDILAGTAQYSVFKRSVSEIVQTVEVKEFTKSYSEIIISPNPTSGPFVITGNDFNVTNGLLEIFNAMGEKIYLVALNSKSQIVNCKLSAGMYFVSVRNDESRIIRKLIVE